MTIPHRLCGGLKARGERALQCTSN